MARLKVPGRRNEGPGDPAGSRAGATRSATARRRQDLDPEGLAIEALGFLAADPARLDRFLALTGLDPGGLRSVASGPRFVAAVLSYLASDDTVLIAFAQAGGYDPEAVGRLVRAVAERDAGD